MEELQRRQGEWFFLHELNVDKVFSTIQRADYLHPLPQGRADIQQQRLSSEPSRRHGAAGDRAFQGHREAAGQRLCTWKTDREAGRTYVELSSKAVELMAEEQALLQRCYRRMRAELGDEELRRAAATMQRAAAILKEEREKEFPAAQYFDAACAGGGGYSLRQWLHHSWKRGSGFLRRQVGAAGQVELFAVHVADVRLLRGAGRRRVGGVQLAVGTKCSRCPRCSSGRRCRW